MSDGGPSFPVGSGDMRDPTGMNLRDYFAAKAMQGMIGIIANGGNIVDSDLADGSSMAEIIAEQSYFIADAMLAKREK